MRSSKNSSAQSIENGNQGDKLVPDISMSRQGSVHMQVVSP